ncbi:MAG: hypothetical protein EOL87_15260 [Spartobacteria bacterium]|nr:hypothetical protein [Spartobacteria bacterium]
MKDHPSEVIYDETSHPDEVTTPDKKAEKITAFDGFPLDEAPSKGRWLTFWKRPSKRERQMAVMQQSYFELIGLMHSIRDHLESGARGQEHMMLHIPEAMEGLRHIGRSADKQAEVLDLLQKQQERSLHQDQALTSSMDRFNTTLGTMDENQRNAMQLVRELSERTMNAEGALHEELLRSQRRLVYLIGFLVLSTGLVLAAFIMFILRMSV